ncbi:MAG: solute carrier family 23 protein, partial [Planctomycetota bacterium]|nr:solute carrier family 23 protein [Planctomycetota bacterium]
TLFGLISAVGIQQLSKADLASDRTLFIAGFSLFMGLSVPTFFTAKLGGMTGPGDIHAVYLPTADAFLTWFPKTMGEIVATVGKSGMGVAAIIGLVLDNTIPGTNKERGITE